MKEIKHNHRVRKWFDGVNVMLNKIEQEMKTVAQFKEDTCQKQTVG